MKLSNEKHSSLDYHLHVVNGYASLDSVEDKSFVQGIIMALLLKAGKLPVSAQSDRTPDHPAAN